MGRSASLFLAAALLAPGVLVAAGCTHSTLSLSRGGSPTPTAPPGGSVTVLYYRTVSGAAPVTVGECVGIGFHDDSGRFSSATTVSFRDAGGTDAWGPFDATSTGDLTVDTPQTLGLSGFPTSFPPAATDYPCKHLPADPTGLVGTLSAHIDFGGGVSVDIPDVLEVTAKTPSATLTSGTPLSGQSLPTRNESALYQFTASAPYSLVVLGSNDSNFNPRMVAMTTDHSKGYRGYDILMLPGPATYDVLVDDSNPDATTGWSFTVNPSNPAPATGTDPLPMDACAGATVASPAGIRDYTIDYSAFTTTSNPNFATNCNVKAPGNDAFLLFTVPANSYLNVGAMSVTDDPVLYILPVAAGCPLHPINCNAAADDFGASDGSLGNGSGTEDAFWYNNTGSSQDVYLVIDNYNSGSTGIGYVHTEQF